MCYYQPMFFECPTCHNVVERGGEERECEDYIKTMRREKARVDKWREGSRERAPPTPFIYGWCTENGNTTKNPITIVSPNPCGTCIDAGWGGGINHPSPSDSEASTSFMGDGYLSPRMQAPLTPLTSIGDELDNDKMELDFPMLNGQADPRGRPVRQSERIRAREEKKAEAAVQTQTRTKEEARGRPPTSTRRRQ